MQSPIKNIVLVGAGGNAGPAILTELMKSPFNVSVLSRADSKSTFPPGVKVIKSDYSHESLVAALQGSNAVISLMGATDLVAVEKKLINASIDAGVSHFVPSQFGSDLDNPRCVSLVPMFETKREIVDYLREKEGSGLSWTGIYSGPFLDWGIKIGFFGPHLPSKTATIFDGGDTPFAATNLGTIGRALIGLLSDADALAAAKNRSIYISSTTVTQNDILASLEKATGEKFQVKHVKADEVIPSAKAKAMAGDYMGILELIQCSCFGPEAHGDWKGKDAEWNKLLGIEPESLEDAVEYVVKGKGPVMNFG